MVRGDDVDVALFDSDSHKRKVGAQNEHSCRDRAIVIDDKMTFHFENCKNFQIQNIFYYLER